MQVEYATDLVFHKQDVIRPLYEALTRTAIHAVKGAEQVATFLGSQSTDRKSYEGEIGNDFQYPPGRDPPQALHGPCSHQDVRQVRAGLAGGDHLQRCHLLQAPPPGWNIETGRGR